jgi:hypothetical protein
MTIEIKYLGEFKSKIETARDNESGDQAGTFGVITLDQQNFTLLSL